MIKRVAKLASPSHDSSDPIVDPPSTWGSIYDTTLNRAVYLYTDQENVVTNTKEDRVWLRPMFDLVVD